MLNRKKKDIQNFWGDTCQEWYSELDRNLNRELLYENLTELERMFKYRKHLSVVEMNLADLKNKHILEIGCGGGGHSALFQRYGAHVTAIDITEERVASTALKLNLIKEGSGLALRADAENLPFLDNSFEIIYSNGVLHHTENTEKCVQEVSRVLQPQGKAIIMLYSRVSAYYLFNLLPRTIVTGMIFRYPEAERLGIMTEGKPKSGAKNPFTRVFSRKEIISLFKSFQMESLRKNGFFYSQLPLIGKLRIPLLKALGKEPFPGGNIVYGAPFYAETGLELFLSPYLGFAWNIIVKKTVK
jgi:ubiquinone/menaquinone biosynthesis C-methylase UbiE